MNVLNEITKQVLPHSTKFEGERLELEFPSLIFKSKDLKVECGWYGRYFLDILVGEFRIQGLQLGIFLSDVGLVEEDSLH